MGRIKTFSKGEVIFTEGHPFNSIYLIKSGIVDIYKITKFWKLPVATGMGQRKRYKLVRHADGTQRMKTISRGNSGELTGGHAEDFLSQLQSLPRHLLTPDLRPNADSHVTGPVEDKFMVNIGSSSVGSHFGEIWAHGTESMVQAAILGTRACVAERSPLKRICEVTPNIPFSLVASNNVQCIIISKVDFCRASTQKTVEYLETYAVDNKYLWDQEFVENLFITQRKWERFKRDLITDVHKGTQ